MKRTIFFFLPLLVLILAACSGIAVKSAAAPANVSTNAGETGANPLERADKQGAVTVTVTPTNLSSPGETLDFDVTLETHTVELSMELGTLSTLKTDTGITVKATGWDGPKGGHHVEGKLSFPAIQDGKSILQDAKTLTITIQKVDAEARTFSWEITK